MVTQSPQNKPQGQHNVDQGGGDPSALRILLVEDNLETADLVRHLLHQEGFQVVEANTGGQAMQLITSVERGEDPPFDVALLDIMLPEFSGYEICQEIRRTERLGYIPIIMVTALSTTEDMVRGLDLGADDYLVKPFNHRELLARVRAALRVRDVERTMQRRNWQLALLNDLSDAINESLEWRAVLRSALEYLLQRLDLDYAVSFVRDWTSGEIGRVYFCDRRGWGEEEILNPESGEVDRRWRERSAYQMAREVIRLGQRRWETDARDWPTPEPHSGERGGWRASVPLTAEATGRRPFELEGAGLSAVMRRQTRDVLGVLMVGVCADQPMIDLNLLTAIGNQVGQALEKCRFFQQARDRGEELAALFNSISDLIYVVDAQYRIKATNSALSRWLGKRGAGESGAQSVVGAICHELLYGRSQPCEACQMVQVLSSGVYGGWAEHRRRPDWGREDWEISAFPIQGRDNAPSEAIIVARDVTERRLLEASLSQSEKLAALGQLAAGLAHEINNPLTAIVANVQLMLLDADAQDPSYESLELIKRASDRAVKVVRNLLDFSRQEQYKFVPTDVNDSLRAALDLVRHQFLIAQVRVIEELKVDLPRAMASGDHLQGVWLNLLLNARDAVTQRSEVEPEPTTWVSSSLAEDGRIQVAIRDNGMGIPPEQLNRIFDPFFTTKDPGKGTGLGLSTAFHVISQHGGEIQADSQVGAGTTFRVLLPRA